MLLMNGTTYVLPFVNLIRPAGVASSAGFF